MQLFHAHSRREQVQQLSKLFKEGLGCHTTGQKLLTATGKWEGWLGTKSYPFVAVSFLLFKINKRDHLCAWGMAFSPNTTHYGQAFHIMTWKSQSKAPMSAVLTKILIWIAFCIGDNTLVISTTTMEPCPSQRLNKYDLKENTRST